MRKRHVPAHVLRIAAIESRERIAVFLGGFPLGLAVAGLGLFEGVLVGAGSNRAGGFKFVRVVNRCQCELPNSAGAGAGFPIRSNARG